LPNKLEAEAEGILAWMVQGCIKYLQTGLEEPQAVRIATEEYRESSDYMRLFLQTECKITGSPDDFERVLDLSNAFNAWRMDRAESVWGRTTVSKALKERELTPIGPAGQMYQFCKRSIHGYSGIVLSDPARDRVALYGEELRAAVGRKS
jgi:putative DNA primase/helicase